MVARDEPAAGAARLVEVVRAWRHGAVNRLQVALGWLQLGRPERAAAALADWCRQLEWEGAALRHWPPEAAAFYLTWRARCEAAGLEVVWRPPGGPAGGPDPARGRAGAGGPAGRWNGPDAARLAAVLEAAREAARQVPGQRIWLQWDGPGASLVAGLEGNAGPEGEGPAAG
ncbi:hypothetical protein Tmar_2203 [Thermaerobacter marianensis DSM 12885]|uniref:SpoOB alpha-helical domain-containing protein n=1 Tax=Thermaerobacter marianensis (strain ATCC 700841 / DSM 12885 / JCM 10246 / 7p75a) TaxID=644966 RepID=E6SKC5_THEM7|nr:Spo0B domain-containing protein [Thermaerobacter marianensis]ADU52283.1 hypothetical protein Tmar_2203 [Thermaerobacter marianensis DSM 12885]